MEIFDAGILTHLHENTDLGKDLLFHFGIEGGPLPLGLEAHAPEHGAVEFLHPQQSPLQLGFRLLEVLVVEGLPAPVGHGAAEAVDADPGIGQLAAHLFELFLGDVVDVGAVDLAGFDELPAQSLRNFDLAVDPGSGFIGESGVVHDTLLPQSQRYLGSILPWASMRASHSLMILSGGSSAAVWGSIRAA